MKTKISLLLFLSITLLICSCKTQNKEILKRKDTTSKSIVQRKSLLIENSLSNSNSEKGFTINSASIEKDTIIINISYPGGCGKHSFDLIWNGNLVKTLPVKAPIYIRHISEAESCSDMLNATLYFDLSALKKSNKKVFMLLNGYNKNSLLLE